ncbi:hypothetical protein [Streptomyces sp. NPDC051546]|uniref:hypothetical protein n=1 Tax=Streptomyces sp. NPDC051546 TaxID=3365655 RepID=UPI0037927DA2
MTAARPLPATLSDFVQRYPSAAPAVEAQYNPAPEQEQAAYAYAVSALTHPLPDLTLADLHAIANGHTLQL